MILLLAAAFSAAAAAGGLDPASGPNSNRVSAELFERINAVRTAHSRKPLVLVPALTTVAGARAALGTDPPPDPDESASEDREAALRSGYEAQTFSIMFVQAEGDADDVLAAAGEAEQFTDEIVREDFRDIGIGVSKENPPLYVLALARSMPDFFAERTAALADPARVRQAILDAVNRARAAARLLPLRSEPMLDEAADRHARDMLARSYYAHESLEGSTVLERSKALGYRPRFAGENIARGQYSIEEVMAGWLGSPVHREHILARNFTDTGSAVAFGKNANGWQVIWVQTFGRQKEGTVVPMPARR